MFAICSSTLKMVALSPISVKISAEYRGLAGAVGPPGARQRRVAGFFLTHMRPDAGKAFWFLYVSRFREIAKLQLPEIGRSEMLIAPLPAQAIRAHSKQERNGQQPVLYGSPYNSQGTAHEKHARYSVNP